MVHQCHNFTLDDGNRLTAALTYVGPVSTVVNGTVSSIDLGQLPPGFNINTSSIAPFGRFAVVFDWTAIDTTIAASYWIIIQGADDAAFSTGATRLGVMFLGSAGQTGHQFDTPPQGREVFYVDNVSIGSVASAQNTKRFIRLQIVAFGSGTPNLVVSGAWIAPI
jgi:hypothetical protein